MSPAAGPCVVLFLPSGHPKLNRSISNIVRAAGYHVLEMEDCDLDDHRAWWEREVAPLEGPLIIFGADARRTAERVRRILEAYEIESIRVAPIGSDPDPHLSFRAPEEFSLAASMICVFWPRWEPKGGVQDIDLAPP